MAEAYDVSVAPHAHMGRIALACNNFKLMLVRQMFLFKSKSLGIHYNKGFLNLLDFVQ